MWLNLSFTGLIILGAVYLLISVRKEVPFLLIMQALIQYVWTLGSWSLQLNKGMTWLLFCWMISSSLLLLWGRNLSYSKELFSIRLFFSVGQWTVLLLMGILIVIRTPYEWVAEGSGGLSHTLTLHPALKLSGNLLIFTTFFQIILHWGQMWSIRKSLIDFGPALVYFCSLLLIRLLQFQSSTGALALY